MKQHLNRLLAPCVGLVLAVFLWWLGAWCLSRSMPIAANLSPLRAFPELFALLGTNLIWEHTLTSLKRVLAGLGFALLVGVPAGILTGISMGFSRTTGTLFQFLRMISPLSWMPSAVRVLCGSVAKCAQYGSRCWSVGCQLVAARPQFVRHALGEIAPGHTAGNCAAYFDRCASGHRGDLDSLGAGGDAGGIRRIGLLHSGYAGQTGLSRADGHHIADRLSGISAGPIG
jgi:hypothetical protein